MAKRGRGREESRALDQRNWCFHVPNRADKIVFTQIIHVFPPESRLVGTSVRQEGPHERPEISTFEG